MLNAVNPNTNTRAVKVIAGPGNKEISDDRLKTIMVPAIIGIVALIATVFAVKKFSNK